MPTFSDLTSHLDGMYREVYGVHGVEIGYISRELRGERQNMEMNRDEVLVAKNMAENALLDFIEKWCIDPATREDCIHEDSEIVTLIGYLVDSNPSFYAHHPMANKYHRIFLHKRNKRVEEIQRERTARGEDRMEYPQQMRARAERHSREQIQRSMAFSAEDLELMMINGAFVSQVGQEINRQNENMRDRLNRELIYGSPILSSDEISRVQSEMIRGGLGT